MELARNEYRAACRGCHGGCVHILTVENGKVVKIRPDKDAPLNQGHACAKGLSVIEQMYHPDRLTYPKKRIGPRGSGRWERMTWDEAYSTMADRLGTLRDRYGAKCIAAITGTGRHHIPYLWRFSKALGTPNITSAGALICLGPRKNAAFSTAGVYSCVDYYGPKKPECIVVWGANPTTSGADGELQWHPQQCAQNGTKFIVIDPQQTELARHAALWLRIRPGTDGALALGILNIIISEDLYDHDFVDNWTYGFEELRACCREYSLDKVSEITWLPREQIVKAAHMMAEIKPLSLEWGCAFEQCYNAAQTCRAIYMIPAVTGNYDVPGGFVESKCIVPTKHDPISADPALINSYPYMNLKSYAHPIQVLNAIRTGEPYKIRAMLSCANNSLLSLPNSRHVRDCLKELEFFVYMDVFMTPTAELADIVLPAAFWPEVDCVFCMPEFAEHTVLCQQKVAQVGECRSDEEVFIELSKRMGLPYGAGSHHEVIEKEISDISRRVPAMKGLHFDELKTMGYFTPERTYFNYKKRGGFPTPSGKFEFYSLEMEQNGGGPLPFWKEAPESHISRPDRLRDYPYILTTGGRQQPYFISNNRQIKSLRRQYPFPLVRMHPETAAAHGITEGDWVFIETARGRITQKAKLEPAMDPRVVNCDFAWWYPEAGAPDYGWDESNANILTDSGDGCDAYMGSYQLRAIPCRIYKNERCSIEARYYSSDIYADTPVDDSSNCVSLDPGKCILCGECVRTCQEVQSIGALAIGLRGGITCVSSSSGTKLSDTDCVGCGQCHAACRTGALRIKTSVERVCEALADKSRIVVAQVAPSVRAGVGGYLGFPRGENSMPLLVDALHKLGFDKVFDTNFAADLTVIEEANEFLRRLSEGGRLPLLTSCCPAWVKFCEEKYPDLVSNVSTCRSPQQMLGALIREHYRRTGPSGGLNLTSVSIMPCTAKKDEIVRRESRTDGAQDIDYSLTTDELLDMLRSAGITAGDCAPRAADPPFSFGSGGAALFGVTGGVTEAVLRYLTPKLGLSRPETVRPACAEGQDGVQRLTVKHGGDGISIAVVSGLNNADRLLRRVRSGEETYHLIEVMACPGGCVMGGGQPHALFEQREYHGERNAALRNSDACSGMRRSQDNYEIPDIYRTLIKEKARELLHRNINR